MIYNYILLHGAFIFVLHQSESAKVVELGTWCDENFIKYEISDGCISVFDEADAMAITLRWM